MATPAWPVQPGGAAPRARNAGRRGGARASGRPVQLRPGRAVRTLAGAGRTCAALPGLPVPGAGVAAGHRSPGAPDFAAGVRPRSGRARPVGRQPAPVCRRIPWRRGGGFRVAGGRRTGRQLPGRPGRCELCPPGRAPAGPREGRRRVPDRTVAQLQHAVCGPLAGLSPVVPAQPQPVPLLPRCGGLLPVRRFAGVGIEVRRGESRGGTLSHRRHPPARTRCPGRHRCGTGQSPGSGVAPGRQGDRRAHDAGRPGAQRSGAGLPQRYAAGATCSRSIATAT